LHPIKLSGGDDVVEIAHNFMYTVWTWLEYK
jgi:hypothetical protein